MVVTPAERPPIVRSPDEGHSHERGAFEVERSGLIMGHERCPVTRLLASGTGTPILDPPRKDRGRTHHL